MIVVERGPLLEPQIVAVAVVAIVLEDDDLLWTEAVDDVPDDGRLAGAGSARDADDDRFRLVGRCGRPIGAWHAHDLTPFFTVFHTAGKPPAASA